MSPEELRELLPDFALGLLEESVASEVARYVRDSAAARVEARLYIQAVEALSLSAPTAPPLAPETLIRIRAFVRARDLGEAGGASGRTAATDKADAEREDDRPRRGLFGRRAKRERTAEDGNGGMAGAASVTVAALPALGALPEAAPKRGFFRRRYEEDEDEEEDARGEAPAITGQPLPPPPGPPESPHVWEPELASGPDDQEAIESIRVEEEDGGPQAAESRAEPATATDVHPTPIEAWPSHSPSSEAAGGGIESEAMLPGEAHAARDSQDTEREAQPAEAVATAPAEPELAEQGGPVQAEDAAEMPVEWEQAAGLPQPEVFEPAALPERPAAADDVAEVLDAESLQPAERAESAAEPPSDGDSVRAAAMHALVAPDAPAEPGALQPAPAPPQPAEQESTAAASPPEAVEPTEATEPPGEARPADGTAQDAAEPAAASATHTVPDSAAWVAAPDSFQANRSAGPPAEAEPEAALAPPEISPIEESAEAPPAQDASPEAAQLEMFRHDGPADIATPDHAATAAQPEASPSDEGAAATLEASIHETAAPFVDPQPAAWGVWERAEPAWAPADRGDEDPVALLREAAGSVAGAEQAPLPPVHAEPDGSTAPSSDQSAAQSAANAPDPWASPAVDDPASTAPNGPSVPPDVAEDRAPGHSDAAEPRAMPDPANALPAAPPAVADAAPGTAADSRPNGDDDDEYDDEYEDEDEDDQPRRRFGLFRRRAKPDPGAAVNVAAVAAVAATTAGGTMPTHQTPPDDEAELDEEDAPGRRRFGLLRGSRAGQSRRDEEDEEEADEDDWEDEDDDWEEHEGSSGKWKVATLLFAFLLIVALGALGAGFVAYHNATIATDEARSQRDARAVVFQMQPKDPPPGEDGEKPFVTGRVISLPNSSIGLLLPDGLPANKKGEAYYLWGDVPGKEPTFLVDFFSTSPDVITFTRSIGGATRVFLTVGPARARGDPLPSGPVGPRWAESAEVNAGQ